MAKASNFLVRRGRLFGLLLTSVLFSCLCPATSNSDDDFYFQVNTCVLFPSLDPELSDFWRSGPSIGAEIGCYLGPHFAPALSFSYTMLTPNWSDTRLSRPIDEAEREYIEQTSFSTYSLLLLKISDFEVDCPLRFFFTLGGGFEARRASRISTGGYDGGQVARSLSVARPRTETDLLFGFGCGLELGSRGRARFFAEGMFTLTPSRERLLVPLELGLKF